MVTWPAGVTVRPLERDDAAAAVACINAIAAADNSGEYFGTNDYLDALSTPEFDATADSLGVWRDGHLIAYAWVMPPDERDDLTIVDQKGGVHPDHRRQGVGGPLLEWISQRAPKGPKIVVDTQIEAVNEGALVLLPSRGYLPIRYFSTMDRPYDAAPIPPGPVPDGFDVIPFLPAYDESLRLAHNEIFVDHWGTSPKDADDWKRWFTGHHAFRPGLSYLVVDGNRIAAYTLAYEFEADTEHTGVRTLWAGQVGTRREYRGQGLARAALTAVLRAGASAGFERSSLGVDADSPTGAFRLYENLGYRRVSTSIRYRLSQ
jgi:GNAT superfamily N-acetyltransferase